MSLKDKYWRDVILDEGAGSGSGAAVPTDMALVYAKKVANNEFASGSTTQFPSGTVIESRWHEGVFQLRNGDDGLMYGLGCDTDPGGYTTLHHVTPGVAIAAADYGDLLYVTDHLYIRLDGDTTTEPDRSLKFADAGATIRCNQGVWQVKNDTTGDWHDLKMSGVPASFGLEQTADSSTLSGFLPPIYDHDLTYMRRDVDVEVDAGLIFTFGAAGANFRIKNGKLQFQNDTTLEYHTFGGVNDPGGIPTAYLDQTGEA